MAIVDIFSNIKPETVITSVATIVTMAVFTSLVIRLFIKGEEIKENEENKKSLEVKSKFFSSVINGLKNGTISNLKDITNIYEGVGGSTLGNPSSHQDHLGKWLKELLVELGSREKDKSLEDKILQEWHKKLSEFIIKFEEVSPYSELSNVERSILTDISTYLENGDKENAKRKLSEIARMIQTRSEDLNKIRNANKWATTLALAGMVLTIIFGLLSII